MGERSDSLLRGSYGAAPDWGAMLGTGLADVPTHFVPVYRECSLEELVRIVREGLSVPPADTRHPDMRAEMDLLDRYRPQRLVDLGVSRLNAVYAVPTADATPRLPIRRERYVIEAMIDPHEAYVGDMDFISLLIPFIGANQVGLERYAGSFRKYWDSVVRMSDFQKHYRRTGGEDGGFWVAKASAPKKMPRMFFAPEVMIMTPIVSSRHVRVIRRESADAAEGDGYDYDLSVEPGMTWEDER